MVDPIRDGAPNYFDVIKEPMALNKVLYKLQTNKYETVSDWERDINLIWSNAEEYNGEDTLFTYMAKEASLWFTKKMKTFPANQEEEWTEKIQKTTRKFINIISHPPVEIDREGKITKSLREIELENV